MATKKRPPRGEPAQATAEAIRDFVVEKAVEKAAGKIENSLNAQAAKTARQQEKLSKKAARAAEHLDRLSTHLEMLDVWTRTEPAGRQPRFTRDQIAAAAIRIADAEGADALSMRRIASELDAGTMTLYHYIRTKDELLSLVGDAVMGEISLGPDEPLPSSWREALTLIAVRTRDVLQRHPWLLDITDDPAIGPNGVRHFDQTLQAVAMLDVDLATKLEIVSSVDEYVFGYCLNRRNNTQAGDAFDDSMVAYVNGLIDTGEYPALKALVDDLGLDESWTQIETNLRDDSRFDRTLERLLDGIEADLERRVAPSPHRARGPRRGRADD
ncbi:MAG: TetR/AcrR family transcriptional regulator [Acidimicrobiales bacterium]